MLGVASTGLAEDDDEGAGSSKLMKLKFAESFLSTEITEMPIDSGRTLLFHEGDTAAKLGRRRRVVGGGKGGGGDGGGERW